ncbi:hypothetical protein [Roseomonas sp. BN140053]|uniref:hypothetical protein n=1 Tax=Roseomonas sp. BN140053 TaxID=3391898 RepID=UPI0039EA295E
MAGAGSHAAQDGTPARRYDELTRVKLTAAIRTENSQIMPIGASGTVLSVLQRGAAYTVEFTEPFPALENIEASKLTRA